MTGSIFHFITFSLSEIGLLKSLTVECVEKQDVLNISLTYTCKRNTLGDRFCIVFRDNKSTSQEGSSLKAQFEKLECFKNDQMKFLTCDTKKYCKLIYKMI